MNKHDCTPQATVFCGIDVSAASLAVALIEPNGSLAQREFSNCASGHRALLAWLMKSASGCEFRWRPPAFTLWILRWRWMRLGRWNWRY